MKNIVQFYERNKYLIGSICISITVIFWDCLFAIHHFEVNPYLAILMMIEVEVSYIILPYMQGPEPIKKKSKSRWRLPSLNKVMFAIFFLASMTPAALQISDLLVEKMVNKVTTEPTIPIEPKKIDVEFDIKKEEWNKYQISVNDDLNEQQKLALTHPIEKRLNELKDQKSTYTNAVAQFNKDTQEYPEKKRKYDEYKAKGNITFLFDYISLILGFIIMVSLQVMNGYLSREGKKARELNHIPHAGNMVDTKITSGYLQVDNVKVSDIAQNTITTTVSNPEQIPSATITPPPDLTIDSIKERAIQNQF